MNGVIVQTGDVKVKRLTQADIDAAYATYKAKAGRYPRPKVDPTVDQMTAFKTVIFEQGGFYADLAVLMPYGDRLAKRIKLVGRTISADGNVVPLELFGPPTFKHWKRGWCLFITLCRMWDVVTHDTLLEYMDQLDEFDSLYPTCWPLIYQVDVRTRMENVLKIKRRGC